MFRGKRILLGVTGGIAAYKAVDLLRRLTRLGADVYVVMTDNACQFVNPLTFQVLSGHRVSRDMFDPARELEIEHISLAREADLILVAPATAAFLARLAAGMADDLLSTVCLAARGPILVAPSMNDAMYTNAAVQSNLALIRRRGIRVVEPASGWLACEAVGQGRLPDAEVILRAAREALGLSNDLEGLEVVVTAGPTREPIDPVRFISNRSSGKMGIALARRAAQRGARVTLVLGPTAEEPPSWLNCRRVATAAEMAREALALASGADVFIAAAAVADYTPARHRRSKMKKGDRPLALDLKPTRDILATLGARRRRPFLVGFAAETGDPLREGRRKLKEKGADLVVANDVSRADSGFAVDTIEVRLIDAETVVPLPLLSKGEAADRILDRVIFLRARREKG